MRLSRRMCYPNCRWSVPPRATYFVVYFIAMLNIIRISYAVNEKDYLRSDAGADSAKVPPTITRGMLIDAGSGGSRLHVYRWQPRIFKTVPPPLTYPTSDEKWTGRNTPAIQTFIDDLDGIERHLEPLIDFAKSVLSGLEAEYHNYPIFFKATGGLRELPQSDREKILNQVRKLLSDKKFNPFYFRGDFARVISGEEEAIYSWSATNFLMGTLLPASQGLGTVVAPINGTYGTLDLGGSSTQIAFFAPDQDIMEGLFKLQIGNQKHWNVYAKSFLKFGINSARERYLSSMADDYTAKHPDKDFAVVPEQLSYCFHSGYNERVLSTAKYLVEIVGPAVPAQDQYERCSRSLQTLMFPSSSQSYCHSVYHGDCSIADAYQPPLPQGKHGNFVGTSSYTYPWQFLLLPPTASLELFEMKAKKICSLSFRELMIYYDENNLNMLKEKISDQIPYFCFLSSYVMVLLVDGYGFKRNQTLTVLDEVKGNKVTWALGAILYEINALPWGLQNSDGDLPWGIILFFACAGLIVGAMASFLIAKELFSDQHHNAFQQHLAAMNADFSRSGDSLSSAATTQLGPPSLSDKNWVINIPQFNPFHTQEMKLFTGYDAVPSSESSGRQQALSEENSSFLGSILNTRPQMIDSAKVTETTTLNDREIKSYS